MESAHDPDEISEVLAREPGNNEVKVKPDKESIENKEYLLPDSITEEDLDDNGSKSNEKRKNEFARALADRVWEEESDDELSAINAVAEFQNNKESWSEGRVKAGKDLICFDVEESMGEDQVEDAEDDNEDYWEVYDESLGSFLKEAVANDTRVAKKELHNYDENSGKEYVSLFNIVKTEVEMLGNQETSD